MNIDKFKHQHIEIMEAVNELRRLVAEGIVRNADRISAKMVSMSGTIKLHLSVEDSVLYPALQKSQDATHVALGNKYRSEMDGLAAAYTQFAGKWLSAKRIADDADGFRAEANTVFKALHERIQRENKELYPVLEQM